MVWSNTQWSAIIISHFFVHFQQHCNALLVPRQLNEFILFPLHPVSLMHKNPQRRKIIHERRPAGLQERSINLKMIFWYSILFVEFLWLLFKDAYLFLFSLFLCFKYIEGLYFKRFGVCLRINCWLHKGPGIFNLGHLFFLSQGLMIFDKMSPRTHQNHL